MQSTSEDCVVYASAKSYRTSMMTTGDKRNFGVNYEALSEVEIGLHKQKCFWIPCANVLFLMKCSNSK